MSNDKYPSVLFRLITKDGINTGIQEGGANYMPEIIRSTRIEFATVSPQNIESPVLIRRYKAVRHYTAEFVEYEEV